MHTVFGYGFRVFFLSAAAYAVVLMAAWMAHFALGLELAGSNPLAWHAHEVLFGVVAAAVWLAARVGYLVVDPAGDDLAALALRLLDLAFLPGLALVIAVPILETGNRRNLVMVVLLLGLFSANLLHGIPALSRAATFTTIDLVTLLMALIGGRIAPAFTRSWLLSRGRGEPLPITRPWLERAAIVSLVALVIAGLVDRGSTLTAVLALSAALLHLLRLLGWRGWRAIADPLVWVLHLGYLWIVVGLSLRGLGILFDGLPEAAWLHAIGVGAMGTLILGVMARVSLGHTGRSLTLPRFGSWIFGLITLAALVRSAAALGLLPYMSSIQLAGLAWIAAFGLFLVLYIPILFAPRADGKPG